MTPVYIVRNIYFVKGNSVNKESETNQRRVLSKQNKCYGNMTRIKRVVGKTKVQKTELSLFTVYTCHLL